MSVPILIDLIVSVTYFEKHSYYELVQATGDMSGKFKLYLPSESIESQLK